MCLSVTGPDSLVVRASASGSEGRGFAPRPRHTKGVKNGTGSSLADARNKRVVPGRYKNAGRYLYPPQTVFVGGYTVFRLSVRPNERTNERTNESVSVTFCFLNIFKTH